MEREQLAWAAGFFDGEGTFSLIRSRGGASPRVSIGQVDREVLDRFVVVIGVGHVKPNPYVSKNLNHRPRWDYVSSGYQNLQHTVALLWPWLGTVKRGQASRCMVGYRDWLASAPGRGAFNAAKTRCSAGHPYVGENIIWCGPDRRWRKCRVCDLLGKGCHAAAENYLAKIDEIHDILAGSSR